MSLCALYKTDDGWLFEKTWQLGETKPLILSPVTEIQVTGDELEHIITNFANLVYPVDSETVVWKGEMAQFIWDHL